MLKIMSLFLSLVSLFVATYHLILDKGGRFHEIIEQQIPFLHIILFLLSAVVLLVTSDKKKEVEKDEINIKNISISKNIFESLAEEIMLRKDGVADAEVTFKSVKNKGNLLIRLKPDLENEFSFDELVDELEVEIKEKIKTFTSLDSLKINFEFNKE